MLDAGYWILDKEFQFLVAVAVAIAFESEEF